MTTQRHSAPYKRVSRKSLNLAIWLVVARLRLQTLIKTKICHILWLFRQRNFFVIVLKRYDMIICVCFRRFNPRFWLCASVIHFLSCTLYNNIHIELTYLFFCCGSIPSAVGWHKSRRTRGITPRWYWSATNATWRTNASFRLSAASSSPISWASSSSRHPPRRMSTLRYANQQNQSPTKCPPLHHVYFNHWTKYFPQNVFERLVDIICDKMSESLDSDPTLVSGGAKGQRLSDPPQTGPNANCNC